MSTIHAGMATWPTSAANAFRRFAPDIPEALDGDAFLAQYQGTTDLVTRVDPSRRYALRTPAAHPVHEHERVTEWARQLRSRTRMPRRLGALMYESHASYSACGLGSDGNRPARRACPRGRCRSRNLRRQDHRRRQRRNGGGARRRRSAGCGPRHRASVRRRDRPRRARVRGELPGRRDRGDSTRGRDRYRSCAYAVGELRLLPHRERHDALLRAVRAFHDAGEASFVHDGHAVADLEDLLHVAADHQDRHPVVRQAA